MFAREGQARTEMAWGEGRRVRDRDEEREREREREFKRQMVLP